MLGLSMWPHLLAFSTLIQQTIRSPSRLEPLVPCFGCNRSDILFSLSFLSSSNSQTPCSLSLFSHWFWDYWASLLTSMWQVTGSLVWWLLQSCTSRYGDYCNLVQVGRSSLFVGSHLSKSSWTVIHSAMCVSLTSSGSHSNSYGLPSLTLRLGDQKTVSDIFAIVRCKPCWEWSELQHVVLSAKNLVHYVIGGLAITLDSLLLVRLVYSS